jgi:hypothetical protein
MHFLKKLFKKKKEKTLRKEEAEYLWNTYVPDN